jgi:hypothetical protein
MIISLFLSRKPQTFTSRFQNFCTETAVYIYAEVDFGVETETACKRFGKRVCIYIRNLGNKTNNKTKQTIKLIACDNRLKNEKNDLS